MVGMLSILIVDDYAPFRTLARALLERDGFRVVGEAEDGTAAVTAARLLRPEVVLLDVQLPDLDGFAVCDALLAETDPPIVFMTSDRPASTFRQRLDRSGAAGFIPKVEIASGALASLLSRD
jgi:CheY-like chemotaxis protein